jgi:ribosomal protein S18 acetylase RimI-like enzyme
MNRNSGMNFMIRKAIPEDIPGIARTAAEAWHQTYAATIPDKVRRDLLDLFYSPGWLERAINRTDGLFETAITDDGQVTGFAQWVYAVAPSAMGAATPAMAEVPPAVAVAPPAPAAVAPPAQAASSAIPPASSCELTRIYVRPACQSRGIGTALIRHGLDKLPEHITLVSLGVKSDNAQARQFYENRGFIYEKEGRLPVGNFEFQLSWFIKRRGVNGWTE